ncbi:MAG: T9SS type A sorting domain-containing protein, partial [Lewinellaceae bacterium]|nr:T9SS type A sorting domain-containing protein [Lewinellaceae bacterium]
GLIESDVKLQFGTLTGVHTESEDPTCQLGIYPNPFVDKTTVAFELPEACTARLRVRDTNGRELYQSSRFYPAGSHQEELILNDLPSGALYCELVTPFGVLTKKMVKMKK